MSRVEFRRRLALVTGVIWFLALYLLAPSTPALAQGGDKAEKTLKGDEKVPFEILGKNFDFGRDVSLYGKIEFINFVAGTIVIDTATVEATESNKVILFGKETFLRSMDLDLNNSRTGGGPGPGTPVGSFKLKFFDDEIDIAINGDFAFKNFPFEKTADINVAPVLTLNATQLANKIPPAFKVFKDIILTFFAGKVIDVTVDVKVTVNQKADIKKFTINYPDEGVDAVGTMKFTSTTTVTRDVSLLKLGVTVLTGEVKFTGKANVDLADTTHQIDAHPRFTEIKGKETATIGDMAVKFGGSLKGEITVNIPVAGVIPFPLFKIDLPNAPFTLPQKMDILYNR